MTDIIRISAAAIITVLAAVGLRRQSPGISLLIAASGGVMILLFILPEFSTFITEVSELGAIAELRPENIQILIKTAGICLAGKFTSEFCRDSGCSSLASKIELASRITIIVLSLPLYEEILSTALTLLSE